MVIDAGHGEKIPGAVAHSVEQRKDIALIIALKTKQLLEDAGYTLVMTRYRGCAELR